MFVSNYRMNCLTSIIGVLAMLAFHACPGFGAVHTPCNCNIDLYQQITDCSNRTITDLTDIIHCIPKDTRKLFLNGNEIVNIPPRIFTELTSLQSLNIGHNNITHVVTGAFTGLDTLLELSMHHNQLNFDDSYSDDAFTPLPNLRRLELQGNCNVSEKQCTYPDVALSTVVSLEYLHIDGIPNVDLGEGFAHLTNLTELVFDDTNGYCSMPSLTVTSFAPLRHTPLSRLSMDGCDVMNLQPNVFKDLLNLQILVMIDNPQLCSDGIENATVGLNKTKIKSITFQYWCRVLSDYLMLRDGMLKGLTNTSLNILELSWNAIKFVDPGCIENLPISIEYLSFKENQINDAHFLSKLSQFDNLKTLDMSYQNHNDVGTNAENGSSLESRSVESVKKTVESNVSGGPGQEENVFRYIQNSDRNGIGNDFTVYLPKNLQTLLMNNIKLQYPIPPLQFGPNKLEYLDASNCLLLGFLGPWVGLRNLNVLDMSENRLTYFHPKSLVDMQNLTTLMLQSNKIGSSLYKDIDGQTFSGQTELEILDLSDNSIKDLPYKMFQNQTSLRKLSIADNSLKNLSFSLRSMGNLTNLDLSNNQIEYLSDEDMDCLDQLATKHQIKVDLTGNILSCHCDNQKFLEWLAITKVNIVEKDKLQCLYINETTVQLSRLGEIRKQLKYECSSWIAITSCIVSFCGLLLIVSLVALFYHKRWELKYLYYTNIRKLNPYHPLEERQILLDIDAYISYDQDHEIKDGIRLHDIVADTIFPFFEEKGFTLKIREELSGGEALYHVILEAIRKCRKVVVLLTPLYCRDYWNTFEFNMAANEGIYTRRDVVIPVLVGNVDSLQLTPEIKAFVRSKVNANQFIYWDTDGDFESHMNEFLNNLEVYLPNPDTN